MPQPSKFDPKNSAPTHAANVAAVATSAGATYTATEQTLLNNLKASVNALLAMAKEAGLMNQD